MTKRDLWDVASTGVLVGAAVAMFGFYLHDRAYRREPTPRHMEDWEEWHESAVWIGPEHPRLVVAAFIDFTCPACKRLAPVLDSVLTEFKGDVALEIHYFPLNSHEFSLPAAVAADCGFREGKFIEMMRTLYAQMDSLGTKPWAAMAVDAGLGDIQAFEKCIELPADSFPRIADGRALGKRIGIPGTPTVLVNGTFFSGRSLSAFRNEIE